MANIKKVLIKGKKGLGLRPFMLSLMVSILVAFLMIMFASSFISERNPDSELLTDSQWGLGDKADSLQTSVSGLADYGEEVKRNFDEAGEPSATDYLFLIFKGAFYVPFYAMSVIYSTILVLVSFIFPMLGGNVLSGVSALLTGVLISGLVITGVFLAIKAIRTGESER